MDVSRIQDNRRLFDGLDEAQVREKLAQYAMLLSYNRQVVQRMRRGGACAWCNQIDLHDSHCLANAIIRVVDLTLGPSIADDGTVRVSISSSLLLPLERLAAKQNKTVVLLSPPPLTAKKEERKKPLTFSESVMRVRPKPKVKLKRAPRETINVARYAKARRQHGS